MSRRESNLFARPCLAFLMLVAMSILTGCRALPASIGMTLIGDAVSHADVKNRYEKLSGKGPEAADEMFGSRLETLVDTRRPEREVMLYNVKGDVLGSSRYVVEVSDGAIIAVSKKTKNKDGVEDVVRQSGLKGKLIGKNPRECESEGELGKALLVLRSHETGTLVRIYDAANWTHFGGARYCILRFDDVDLCEDINLVGLDASSKKGGVVKGRS